MTDCVAIFRKRLLSYTETFIADQGQLLPTYRPVYVGYKRELSGADLIAKSTQLLLDDFSKFPEFSKLRLRLGFSPNKNWLSALKKTSPALIHSHFLNDGIDATILGKRLSIPTIATVHGHDITKRQKVYWVRKDSRFFFEHVDRVIAVSDFIAQQALMKGCPENKLTRHRIGIDLERFTQKKMESERPSLLFIGRLVEKKGCTYLLQATAKIKDRFPDLTLTIVGDGVLRTSLEQEAVSLGLSAQFVGRENAQQIRQRLAESWLFVAPSITAGSGDAEGLPIAFLEAQAMSTPVVSFHGGGVSEAIEDEASGLLCQERDVDALAENIASLLEDSRLRHEMGSRGRERVEEHFDIRKQCAKLEQIYNEVLASS